MNKNNLKLAINLRHELHQNPELSNKEVWTKEHLINFLIENTRLKIVDRGRWFYAIYRASEDKKNIAFRADFDALPIEETIAIPHASKFPGISHKCGHDGHAATLAGLALEIDQNGADKNVYFLFQHAEETGDGAAEAIVFIRENNIDEIFAYHNGAEYNGKQIGYKSIGVIDGLTNFASKGMTIHMEGIPSHASQPEKGKNPAFAIAKIIETIPEFVSDDNNEGLVLCTVIQVDIGEKTFGTSASKGDLLLTIRAFYESELDNLQKNLEKLANNEAEKYGLNVNFTYNDVFPETVNHKESSDKVRHVCKSKGINLVKIDPSRGSEDFGHYLKYTKGAMFRVGNGENYPSLHTANYDFQDGIIETAVEVFKGLVEL